MEFAKKFYQIVDARCREWGGRRRLAEKSGITEDSLGKIFKRITKDPGLFSVSAIVDAVGLSAFLDDQPGGCPEVRRELAQAKKRIQELEEAVSILKGQLLGMQKAHEYALEKLAQSSKPNDMGKNYELPTLNIGGQDAG